MKPFLPRAFLLFILGLCLAAVVVTYTKSSSKSDESGHARELDLTRPVPRDQVLELFRQVFAMPAEDFLNWEKSVEAGKIPPDVRAFHEQIIAFNEENDIDPAALATEGLPFIDLPDGPRVYPVLKATLGPHIGANVSQEDLNTLLPELADLNQRIWDVEARKAEAGAGFTAVQLRPADLGISRVREAPAANTVSFATSQGDDSYVLHVERPAILDGRHVMGARINTEPFVSLYLRLTDEGSKILAEATAKHTGETFAILIGGEYHSAIPIVGQVQTRQLQLPGSFTEERARLILDSWSRAK